MPGMLPNAYGDGGGPAPSLSDFTRLPDGSLVLTGQPKQVSGWDRLKAAAAGLLPARFQSREQPYWIPEMPVQARETQPLTPPTTPAGAWSDVEKEVAYRDELNRAMGDAPKRILANPYIMGEKSWFQ